MWYAVAALFGIALASLAWYKLTRTPDPSQALLEAARKEAEARGQELARSWAEEHRRDVETAKGSDPAGYVLSGLDELRRN